MEFFDVFGVDWGTPNGHFSKRRSLRVQDIIGWLSKGELLGAIG